MNVFQVRYDKGGGKKSLGARCGPEAIVQAFKNIPWRGAEDGTRHCLLEWKHVVVSLEGYHTQMQSVFFYQEHEKPMPFITLSGDNSCSFETVRAVARRVERVALAVIDAHPDACDTSHDPHASWVRRLWEEEIIMPEKTIFFGIRDWEEKEAQYIREKKAVVVTSEDIHDASLHDVTLISQVCTWRRSLFPWQQEQSLPHALVIVVDIDALDPAYAPGTGVLRAGGLNVRHILSIIKKLCAFPFAVKVGEICEVIPSEGNALRPRADKRPDPCGLTVLAADAIFRGMIQSLSI